MKNAKKLTRAQKEFLKSKGYEVGCYLCVKNTSEELVLYNRETKQVESPIRRF